MIDLSAICRPTLLLDRRKCQANLRRLAAKARSNNLIFRPHCKTHQSHVVGRWIRDLGIRQITVSSVSMAAYFARDGWLDITIAFPLNLREIQAINKLPAQATINILIENQAAIGALRKHLKRPVNVFINVDIGYHRSGIPPEQTGQIDLLFNEIDSTALLTCRGLLGHAGHSYRVRSKAAIANIHEESLRVMQQFKSRFEGRYPDLIASVGDTPTCSVMNKFPGMDEIRPGNFVFYDLTQWQIGSCELNDIAVAMACPVVAIHPQRNELIVYGGGIHLSKDRLIMPDGKTIFGLVAAWSEQGWEVPRDAGYVRSLSQEHGIISLPSEELQKIRVGDLLPVIPVHSCMAADLMKSYRTTDGQYIRMMDNAEPA